MADRENTNERSTSNIQRSTSKKAYDLEARLLAFAASIVRMTELLPGNRAGNHVAGQLLRCGTSPLPNHGEAQAAESPADFIHKMSICLKELRETRRWLLLIDQVPMVEKRDRCREMIDECEELIRIFFSSIRTARTNRP